MKIRQHVLRNLLAVQLAILSTTVVAKAVDSQPRPSKEQIQKEKRAFLTKELDLTDSEATALMKVLNELDDKRFRLWKSCNSMHRRMRASGGKITDQEYEKHFTQVMDNRVREAELERTYYTKCKEIIPIRKLVKLEQANRAFARQFMQRNRS